MAELIKQDIKQDLSKIISNLFPRYNQLEGFDHVQTAILPDPRYAFPRYFHYGESITNPFFQCLKRMPYLRRNNRIHSIHSSLLIEANSLSFDEVKDVIDGKEVIGPANEILEVKDAYNAYSRIGSFDGFEENDLLTAHALLTDGLEKRPGEYRKHAEGVFDGNKIIFIAPQKRVPFLMDELFCWLKEDEQTPLLIKSCVFHYEFVFIHPFGDGNGRTARLWQTVLLTKWNPIFEWIPIESQIQKYQNEYYSAIAQCHKNGNSDAFVCFMLRLIDETLSATLNYAKKAMRSVSDEVNRLLDIMGDGVPLGASEIMRRLSIKTRETLRASCLNPALEDGLIQMTIPDKPTSKKQKYLKK